MNITNKKFTLLDSITVPLKITPVYTLIEILYKLISAIVPAINIWVTANFINTAISIVNDNKPIGTITIPILFLISVIAWNIVSGGFMTFIYVRFSINLRKVLRESFMTKRAKLNYKYLENQESWDLIARVAGGPEDKFASMFNETLGFISMVISTASILMVLIVQIWWIAIVVVLVSIPLMYIAIKSGEKSYETNKEVTKIQRKYNYLNSILTSRDAVLERSLFGYSEKLNTEYKSEFEKARLIEYKVQKKWFIKMKTGGVVTALLSIFIVIMLINPTLTGVITVGMFISLVNATFGLVQSMSWELSYNMESLAKNKEFMKDLTKFSQLEEQDGAEVLPLKEVDDFKILEFKNVSFKYPDTETYILKNLSFKIEKDKHYSFVGINGAGKTTLTKLITGLFREYEGEILLNNKDLKSYSLSYLKTMFCGVFQDFAKYSITVKDNIGIGNANLISEETSTSETISKSDEAIKNAIELVGLTEVIAKLPKGLDTPLGKIKEGGLDISGGEWQRIAMSRAIVNPAQVKILDEPTAALDPISESQMYQKFEQISQNKTTLFISHRLGSTKLADIIYVLDNGSICESGSHDELMQQNNKYAEMFESQRSWYL